MKEIKINYASHITLLEFQHQKKTDFDDKVTDII